MGDALALQRFTTRYIPAEDRMRLAGELAAGQQVVLWLSQRLWLRLLPGLFGWLDKQVLSLPAPVAVAMTHREMQHSFALVAARQDLQAEPPVVPLVEVSEWLVDVLLLEQTGACVRIVFQKGGGGERCLSLAVLQLSAHQLRQWLLIVHRLWQQAEWPAQVWPTWWADAGAAETCSGRVVH